MNKNFIKKAFSNLDYYLILGIILLTIISIICLYSSNDSWNLPEKQLIRFCIGFLAMLITANISPGNWYKLAPWLYCLGVSLLLGVEFMGHIGKGAQRWLNLGFIKFEPSELMKLALPLALSWWFHQRSFPRNIKTMLISVIMIAIPAVLILKQPDLGTALLIISVASSLIFLAGIDKKWVIITIALTAISIPLIWQNLHTYQQQRVLTFINPEHDPLGAGYHIIQSKIAIGSGGIWGKGWLNSTQAHLNFLPEHTTDFIFALFAEEFGFIGAIILLSICLGIIFRMSHMTLCAQSTFKRLLSASITIMFSITYIVNIGMVTGILPVVGVPLTFISYGGSSILTMMSALGIVMSIYNNRDLMTH
jgi:rod shape determining protein RodA